MELIKGTPEYYSDALYWKLQEFDHLEPHEAKTIATIIIDEIIKSHPEDWAEKCYYSLAKEYLKNR